jgi:ABC-type nitrate/sulfonate/bicarbonate transport system permease component
VTATSLSDGVQATRARRIRLPSSAAFVGAVSVLGVLAVWQLVVSLGLVSSFTLPAPADIVSVGRDYIVNGTFSTDVRVSATELGLGYGLAVLVAVPLGLLIGRYDLLRKATDPFVSFFFSTPTVAFAPLIIIWFGLGLWSKVLVVFVGAFWPILINTAAGVRETDRGMLFAARSLCASELQTFMSVRLPYALPYTLAGMRLAVGHAIVGVFVGELIASQQGVGKMMIDAGATFQTVRVFVGLLILGISGVVFSTLIRMLERRVNRHKVS